MPPRPTLNVTIPVELMEASQNCADICERTMDDYARSAILLLGHASLNGYNTSDTKLLIADEPVAIPMLASRKYTAHQPKHVLKISRLTQDQRLDFTGFARGAQISNSERARRALRFRNFIVEHIGSDYPVFAHKDETPLGIILY